MTRLKNSLVWLAMIGGIGGVCWIGSGCPSRHPAAAPRQVHQCPDPDCPLKDPKLVGKPDPALGPPL